ncbi:BatA and WFA domain-containing protein [Candidatus Sumerlaeota bacterium]|nr:BatA and WFA domain-containing protein [Candidatus Sumerlaeota bacterium]
MVFHNPWGLLALLSIPAILGLHFFRTHREVRRVGGLHLWDFARTRLPVGNRFDRLMRSLALLFQLLAALSMSLLIAGADLPTARVNRHHAVVLDNSLSMQARATRTMADRARDLLGDWMDSRDRYTVIAAGTRPEILAGPFAGRDEALDALARWVPSEPACDVEAAVNLAGKFVTGDERILFVSDEVAHARAYGETLEIAAVGTPEPNAAIDFADRTRVAEGRDRVFLTLRAYASLSCRTTLRAFSGTRSVFEQDVEVQPDQPKQMTFETDQVGSIVRLEISADSLEADNVAILPPVRIKTVRACVEGLDLVAKHFLQAVAAVPYARMTGDPAEAELVFTTRADYESRGANVRIYEMPSPETTEKVGLALGRDLLIDHRNTITDNLPFEGVLWPYVEYEKRPPGRLLVSCGAQPLIVEIASQPGGAKRILFNLLYDRTNVFRQSFWPVLVQNAIEECRDAMPGLSRTVFRLGESIPLNLRPDADSPARFSLVRDGRAVAEYSDLPEVLASLPAGVYEVRQDGTQPALAVFSVNVYAPGESNLQAMETREPDLAGLEAATVVRAESNRMLYYAALLAVILFAALNWRYE